MQISSDGLTFRQTNAYAMHFGLLLGGYFLLTFAFYIAGIRWIVASYAYFMMLLYIPFMAASNGIRFKRTVCPQALPLGRAYTFSLLQYIYATILLAIGVYVYFAFLDHGHVARYYIQLFADPQLSEQMRTLLTAEEQERTISVIQQTSPSQYAAAFVTMNTFMALLLSLPTALYCHKRNVI